MIVVIVLKGKGGDIMSDFRLQMLLEISELVCVDAEKSNLSDYELCLALRALLKEWEKEVTSK